MRSGFFNSNISGYDDLGNPIYDRAEEASFFAEFFAAFIGNGVYPNPSTGMQVVENSTLGALVKPGKCFIDGYFGKVVPGGEEVRFDVADQNLPRIDRVVARWDLQEREVELHVLKGIASVNPVAPELTRNSNVYELGIADVRIEKGVSVVTQANITDTRLNPSLCGVVTGVVQQLDTSTLFDQYLSWFEERKSEAGEDYKSWFEGFTMPSEAQFLTWFENVKDQLSEDAAGNLQQQIDDLKVAMKNAVELMHPIGSVYTSLSDSTNPAKLFGFGRWERIKDKFLYALGDSGAVGEIGGSLTHNHTQAGSTGGTRLTVNQIPNHMHGLEGWTVLWGQGKRDTYIDAHMLYGVTPANNPYMCRNSTLGIGGGQPHSHTLSSTNEASSLPPYIKAYMWVRVA